MEPATQKLIHTFGALADLGQEIAGTGDFNEMVRTSMHMLLGTLALRRGAVVACPTGGPLKCAALWCLCYYIFVVNDTATTEKQSFLKGDANGLSIKNTDVSNS